MKKQFVVSAVAGLLVFVLSAVAAQAQTASFVGSTLGFSRNGDFRADGSSCPGGAAPTQYLWTFVEDGVTRTGNPVTHKFVTNWCAYTVQLQVTCPGGTTANSGRFVCFSCGTFGCVNPDRGYN
jgi:hypothetical protein